IIAVVAIIKPNNVVDSLENQSQNNQSESNNTAAEGIRSNVSSENITKQCEMEGIMGKPQKIPEKEVHVLSGEKYFILLTGETLKSHEDFIVKLKNKIPMLKEVKRVDECDFILVFCPIVSRAGTDIEAAVKKIHNTSDTKPAVLVVLHHTFDAEYIAPDSSRAVTRENTITVDCLFLEDQGLLTCKRNNDVFNQLEMQLKPKVQKRIWEVWNKTLANTNERRPSTQPCEPSASPNNQKAPEFKYTNDRMREDIEKLENFKKTILKKEEKVFMSNEVIIAAELNLVLLGRTGSDMTAAKNIILGKEVAATSATASAPETENTQLVAGRKVTVVDTPDWFSPGTSLEEFRQTVGPQAFLLILPVRNSEHNEDKTRVSFLKMEEIFGERCWRNTMIIFSVTDEHQKKSIEQFIQSGDQELQELVKKCENRFHCLNIKESGDGSQVSELLEKIEKMVDRNGTKVFQIIRDMRKLPTAESMASVGEDTIETAALGRPFQLGMLYDCRKDTLIPGITLWNREQLQENKDMRSQVNTEFSVTTSDTIEEKSKHMKVDGELTLSLLGGNVQISGAARYFSDTKKSFKQERLTLHYRTTCRFEQLTMNHLAQGKMDHHEVFDNDVATHVVTAVLYGADAYFVFDKMENLSEDGSSAEGEGKINFDKLKKVFSTGDAHLTLNMNEKEKGELNKLSCTFYGDFQLRSNPSTFEDAMKVYADLPKLIGENGEHAVPVKVWLFPLVKLNSSAGKLQRYITTNLIRAVESVFEALNVTYMKCSDLMQDTVAKTFSTFYDQVQHLQKFCSEYKQDFMRKLAVLLPEIRGGKTDIKHLTELLDAHEKSPFNACDLQKWITVREKKSNQIKALLKQLCDLGAEVTDDLDTNLLDLNVENLVAYAFTCIQPQDPFLTKQKIYLNSSTIKNTSENTHDLDFQDKSLTSTEIMCMKKELKMFSDLIALNKSQTTKFIVQSIPQESPSSASCILLYENGCNEAVCFVPPSKPPSPTIESVTENSITVQLSPSCSATLRRKLLYKMKQDSDWKSQPVHQDIITLTDLQANNDYEMKCAAEGKLDYIVESGVITVSTKESEFKKQTCMEAHKSETTPKMPAHKYFITSTGSESKFSASFMVHLKIEIPDLREVSTVDECDFILHFCLATQPGNITGAPVKHLNTTS
ncbi:verrucotoxin subunit beta-like, partial [Clarias magur]